MFELLATVDPFSALLGSLWLFAAGLFPVGFMLGSSCSPCCGEQCDCSSAGATPRLQPPEGVSLGFQSCFGSGLEATANVPPVGGPCDNTGGPIASVTVTNPGSGYAKLGHSAPTVTATVAGGIGAALSVTLEVGDWSPPEGCGPPLRIWSIASVAVTSGGSGYTDGAPVEFSVANEDSVLSGADATVNVVDGEITGITLNWGGAYHGPEDVSAPPRVDAVDVFVYANNGSGAVLEVVINQDTGSPDFGKVSAVSVTNGGTGYFANSVPCDLPDKFYIKINDKVAEVSLDPLYPLYFGTLWAEPNIPCGSMPAEFDGLSVLYPPSAASSFPMYGVCTSGDYVPPQIGNTYQFARGAIAIPGFCFGERLPFLCQCGGKLHITLLYHSFCVRWMPYTPPIPNAGGDENIDNQMTGSVEAVKVWSACLRFETDENGCPAGDAVVVNPNWFSGGPVAVWENPAHAGASSTYGSSCDGGCSAQEPEIAVSFMPL